MGRCEVSDSSVPGKSAHPIGQVLRGHPHHLTEV